MAATLHPICQLAELAFGTPETRVDAEKGVIYGVRIVGLQSKNSGRTIGLTHKEFGEAVDRPYEYSAKALREAVGKYQGIGVYIDHAGFDHKPDGSRAVVRRERGTAERFGRLVNVHFQEGAGLVGNLEYLKAHPLASLVVEAAQRMPEMLGLSHDAAGRPELVNGKITIVEIASVSSVDLIGERPGTTRGLFETAAAATTKGTTVKITLKQLLEAADPAAPSKPLLAKLLELGGPMGDVPVDYAGEAAPTVEAPASEASVKEALKTAVLAELDKADSAKWQAVFEALGMSDSVADLATGKKGGNADADKAKDDKPKDAAETAAAAALKAAGDKAQASLLECIDLLSAAGHPALKPVLKPMLLLETVADRQAFVDSLPKPSAGGITPRSQSPKVPVTETAKPDGKSAFDVSTPDKAVSLLRGLN